MKYVIHLLLLLIPFASHGEIVSRDLVGKASNIRLVNGFQEDTGLGKIEVQLCSTCSVYELTVTPETIVSKDGKRFALPKFKMYLKANGNKDMRLQFHKNTKEVFYIDLNTLNNKEAR